MLRPLTSPSSRNNEMQPLGKKASLVSILSPPLLSSLAHSDTRITILFLNKEYIVTKRLTVPQLKVAGLVSISNLFSERSIAEWIKLQHKANVVFVKFFFRFYFRHWDHKLRSQLLPYFSKYCIASRRLGLIGSNSLSKVELLHNILNGSLLFTSSLLSVCAFLFHATSFPFKTLLLV